MSVRDHTGRVRSRLASAADPPGPTLPAIRTHDPARRRKSRKRSNSSITDKTREDLVILHEQPQDDSHRYSILGSIHRGGMGEILLAKVEGHDGFSRKVVLKGLLSKLSEDDISYQLFMREARLMANLDHPNIVRVFDLPIIGGKPYLAMEYMRGRNFHQVIQRAGQMKKRGVPPKIALHVVAHSLRGLHYAHSMRDGNGRMLGIVHRDVSPGNLLVSFFGEVKVTDFGIAKIAGSPQFTGPRSIRGKARYVAPEQVHGAQATVLSDIYSAGVVLAEALIGEPLWERSSVPETLLSIVTEDREKTIDRILLNHPNIRGLRAAFRGALALNPRDRFATALQFAEVLEAVGKALKDPVDQVQLGLYVRDLFTDSLDVPKDDGFGLSGFPIPKFTMDDDDTEPTVVELEEGWIKSKGIVSTQSMRPAAPREPMDNADTPHLPDPFKPRVTGVPPPPPPVGLSAIRAAPLPVAQALFVDPAEPPKEYKFTQQRVPAHRQPQQPQQQEVRIHRRVVDERSHELTPFPPKRTKIPVLRPNTQSPALSAGVTGMLLVGIFVGASLAIAGCLIALSFAR
jgi:eukaryotic-like serine/threonine-protein kinase